MQENPRAGNLDNRFRLCLRNLFSHTVNREEYEKTGDEKRGAAAAAPFSGKERLSDRQGSRSEDQQQKQLLLLPPQQHRRIRIQMISQLKPIPQVVPQLLLPHPQPHPNPKPPLPPQQHRRIRIQRMLPPPLPPDVHSHPQPQFVAAKSLILVPPDIFFTVYLMRGCLAVFHDFSGNITKFFPS